MLQIFKRISKSIKHFICDNQLSIFVFLTGGEEKNKQISLNNT